ncbi:MAG: hypothetical protein AAF629_12985 [Chloroflexota bacterium]
MIISCSWCGRWKWSQDSEWQHPKLHNKEDVDSHGICPTCEQQYQALLAVTRKNKTPIPTPDN